MHAVKTDGQVECLRNSRAAGIGSRMEVKMTKKKTALILAVLLIMITAVPAFASEVSIGSMAIVAEASGIEYIIGAIVGGIIVALIVTGGMKAQLKSVRMASDASNYIREGSMKVVKRSDIFLFKNVTKTPKPQDNKK